MPLIWSAIFGNKQAPSSDNVLTSRVSLFHNEMTDII